MLAIHFEDMTEHIKNMRLESQILEEKNKADSLESHTSMISHEFRTPLSTSIMLLEGIVKTLAAGQMLTILLLITNQLNLLLNLVNDLLDVKMIKEGKFVNKIELFNPSEVLDFVIKTLTPQAQSKQILLEFHSHICLGLLPL